MFCLPLFSLKMPAFRKGSEFVIKHVENGNNVHNQRTYAVFPTCAMLKGSITVGLLMNGLLFSYKTLLNGTKGLLGWILDSFIYTLQKQDIKTEWNSIQREKDW